MTYKKGLFVDLGPFSINSVVRMGEIVSFLTISVSKQEIYDRQYCVKRDLHPLQKDIEKPLLLGYNYSEQLSLSTTRIDMPKGTPLTKDQLNQKRHEIFAESAHLFLEKGFFETSMREVAKAVGMGRSSLYDYFHSKEDILIWYFLDDIDVMIVFAGNVARQSLPAIEKLYLILHKQMERLLENKEFYIRFFVEIQRLGGESRQLIKLKRHDYQDILCSIVEQGIQEGAFRPVNSLLATHLLQMALMPPAFTSRPIGTPDEMLDEALTLFLRGVQA